MNVLHVTQNYAPSIGGTQHTIKKVSEYLSQKYQDNVTVYTTNSYYGPNRKKYKKIKLPVEIINSVFVRRFRFLKMHKPLIRFIYKIIYYFFKVPFPEFFKEILSGPVSFSMFRHIIFYNADIICASSIHFLFADYPLWRKYLTNPKPFVLYGSIHIQEGNAISKSYLKRIQSCDYYIANTNFEKKYIESLGIDPTKVEVIGTATDILEYDRKENTIEVLRNKYGYTSNEFVIIYVGRQELYKGLDVLIKAYDYLKNTEPIKLIIAGAEGNYSPFLQSISERDKNIQLFCNISQLEKACLLKLSNVLVLPSKEESFGVVFIEAWSFCKPVIGTNIGAVCSLIDNGIDGLIFESDNHLSLAQKINLLLANPSLQKDMGVAGYKKVASSYQWNIVAGKFRQVYENAIKKYSEKLAKNK